MQHLPCFLFIATALSFTLNGPVFALNMTHHQVNWEAALNLTQNQQAKIRSIEANYIEQQKKLIKRHDSCQSSSHLKAKTEYLQQAMFSELQQVLQPDQLDKANQLIKRYHQQMQLRQLKIISNALVIDEQQKKELFVGIEAMPLDYQWPINMEQRELARQAFEVFLTEHLTEQQQNLWREKKQQDRKTWHQSDAYDSQCLKQRS